MESARCPQPKIPSPTVSAASKGDEKQLPQNEEPPKFPESENDVKPVLPQQQILERVRTTKVADASEATRESMSVKEPASQGSVPPVEEEVQQRMASGEAGNVVIWVLVFSGSILVHNQVLRYLIFLTCRWRIDVLSKLFYLEKNL